jgi:hypothetical protein
MLRPKSNSQRSGPLLDCPAHTNVVGFTFATVHRHRHLGARRHHREFYVAGKGSTRCRTAWRPAADWMSAASFISMAGLIAFGGYGGSVFLMGWTGGYVLLALLLAPYLRKFGKFTVPEFIGDRYYSQAARVVAVICLIIWLDHLRDRSDEGCRRGVLALPRGGLRHGPVHRHGHRVLLRRARRHEGHHLYADRAVLRADPGLHDPGDLHQRCS